MLRPDWPYMGPIHHIKLSARRQLKFSPVTYFFISNKSSKIFSLFKNASMTSTLYPWWSMVQCSIQELTHLCSFCIHSIQACCPFCEGFFSRLACDTQRLWLKGFSWASQTLSLRSRGAHQLTNPMQIQRILIFTLKFLTKYSVYSII